METFSRKRTEIDHPAIFFKNIPVKKVSEHKHLGIILDSKLSFSAHIKSAISKTRKGIGLLKYLSKYLPRHTLNELYKLYVRPHLDYRVSQKKVPTLENSLHQDYSTDLNHSNSS